MTQLEPTTYSTEHSIRVQIDHRINKPTNHLLNQPKNQSKFHPSVEPTSHLPSTICLPMAPVITWVAIVLTTLFVSLYLSLQKVHLALSPPSEDETLASQLAASQGQLLGGIGQPGLLVNSIYLVDFKLCDQSFKIKKV